MMYFYVPLRIGLCSSLWGGHAVPLLMAALFIIGILAILSVSLSVLLLTHRNGKQRFVQEACADEESLLDMEKNLPLCSPPTSDVGEDVLFDKVRDIFVPKFTRSGNSSSPKWSTLPMGTDGGTSHAAGTYDDEFVKYPFYNKRKENKMKTRTGIGSGHKDGSLESWQVERLQRRGLGQHPLGFGLVEIEKVLLTGHEVAPNHQAEVKEEPAKVPECIVGRAAMTLTLQRPERSKGASFLQIHIAEVGYLPLRLASKSSSLRPEKYYIKAKLVSKSLNGMASCPSLYSLPVSMRSHQWRLRRRSPTDCGSVRTNVVEGWHCARFDQTLALPLPQSWTCPSLAEDGEATSPEMTTQRLRARSLSSCEAGRSPLQHLELHLTLKRFATKSHWRRDAEVLGCASITCTPHLLFLVNAAQNGEGSAEIKVEEDFYPLKPEW